MNAQQALIRQAGRVAVLMGGESAEREVSLKSGKAVLAALQSAGVDAFAVDFIVGADSNLLQQLASLEFDTAFIILHGRGGEDGVVQAALQMLGKPYTGSGVAASALAMDKWRTKLVWHALGLPTKPSSLINTGTDPAGLISQLGLPLAIKPVHEGSSVGLMKVNSEKMLGDACLVAGKHDSMVMAEPWVSGKELTVAIVNGKVLPPIWLQTTHEFYDYDAKYLANDTRYNFDTGLDIAELTELTKICQQAFDVIGCHGWGRLDLIRDEQGRNWLLEVNTVPGMTDHSLVPMAAKQAGMSMEVLVLEILASAFDRSPQARG
ncbi:D-alanine--D-alanine ligase [Pokkaliibacter sp. MBI-7]|uniref:D-alanine--D-alanine ligase n=1 Tax=Pokkaliibacter sp. MBI-7 TaxID=3040600 RepID=UPI00244A72A2|nr:D-alanine--D-alanine ligase [Pokkaliibacter sp. MBI-7]MDH2431621.1 D-alanine--D-alanine ligase [Pokkaliibacter sp. MBI-7]